MNLIDVSRRIAEPLWKTIELGLVTICFRNGQSQAKKTVLIKWLLVFAIVIVLPFCRNLYRSLTLQVTNSENTNRNLLQFWCKMILSWILFRIIEESKIRWIYDSRQSGTHRTAQQIYQCEFKSYKKLRHCLIGCHWFPFTKQGLVNTMLNSIY